MDSLSTKTFEELLGVSSDYYKEIKIKNLYFSVRTKHCLDKEKILFVSELLKLSPNKLCSIKNFGNKCLNEVIRKIEDLVDRDNFKKNQTKKEVQLAKLSIDDKLIEKVLKKDPYIDVIIEMLKNFSYKVQGDQLFKRWLTEIPDNRLNTPIEEFIELYNFCYRSLELCEEDYGLTLKQYAKKHIDKKIDNVAAYVAFYNWCQFDIKKDVKKFVSDNLSKKTLIVIKCRSNGNTLEEISNNYGVTRERIRQIEKKGLRLIKSWIKNYKLLTKIKIDLDLKNVIELKTIGNFLGKYGYIFTYALKNNDFEYKYEESLSAYITDEKIYGLCQNFVATLPEIFHERELNKRIVNDDNKIKSVSRLLKNIINAKYNKTGKMYHQSKITMAVICEEILRKHFSRGIHISDEVEIDNFKKYILRDFGIKINSNSRALGAIIQRVGILCDRGIYQYNSHNYISKSLALRIYKYINKSKQPAILTNILYAEFKKDLKKEGIKNKYFLQGILHDLYNDQLYFRRDYISKDNSFVNTCKQINEYIKKYKIPVEKKEIIKAFPGVPDVVINMAILDDNVINLFGSYIYGKNLKIGKGEINYLRDALNTVLNNTRNAVHSKDIFYYIKHDNPTILLKYYMDRAFCCFSVIEYFLKEEYNFSRPYIAKKGIEIERNIDIIGKFIEQKECISISELLLYAKKIHYSVYSILEFINSFNDTHMFLDKDKIATINYIGVNETIVNEIDNMIEDEGLQGTVPISSLRCINNFPKINVPWTEWLLYSVINKWSSKFEVESSSNQFKPSIPLIAKVGELVIDESIDYSNNIVVDNLDNIDDLIGDISIDDLEGEI